ncbi:protein of unknown function [Nitrospira japonica]|uniref:Uncharacterized protein n=1 Tax=Nitrospira japonica TaxID=1325564 RepID=A0A1W1I9C6_9BACT|nr:protein of unknown function [Nitrospira japonica]
MMIVLPCPLHETGQYHTMRGQVSLRIGFEAGKDRRKPKGMGVARSGRLRYGTDPLRLTSRLLR